MRQTLLRIDGRPYGAYRDLTGAYDFGRFRLHVDWVQPDPYAPPSRLRVRAPVLAAGIRPVQWADPGRRTALEDLLLRRFAAAIHRAAGETAAASPDRQPPPAVCLEVERPGQQILQRSGCSISGGLVEFRFGCALPARGRLVQGMRTAAALDVALPEAVAFALRSRPEDLIERTAHLELHEDQQVLRRTLEERGWVAFLADGSLLPRESGRSDLPLRARGAVRLSAPTTLAATVELPHRGPVRGMAIPEGVTAIVGGAYHGKSTLLGALALGVYDHIAGDGRELCVTRADAVKVVAEDGRPVTGVDISAFVGPLPGVLDTRSFSTNAASGSTSQAAAIREALEMGARLLLLDEDQSAANFMTRDRRMRRLVPDDPVIPLVDRLRWLWEVERVSTIMVVGGAGAFLEVSDRVIRMTNYLPTDAGEQARSICAELPDDVRPVWTQPTKVRPRLLRVDAPRTGARDMPRVRIRDRDGLVYGETPVDLHACSQLVEVGQVRALGEMLRLAFRYADGRRSLEEVARAVGAEIDRGGIEVLSPWPGSAPGGYTRPRGLELACVLNRFPGLAIGPSAE